MNLRKIILHHADLAHTNGDISNNDLGLVQFFVNSYELDKVPENPLELQEFISAILYQFLQCIGKNFHLHTVDALMCVIVTELIQLKAVNKDWAHTYLLDLALSRKLHQLSNLLLDEYLCDLTCIPRDAAQNLLFTSLMRLIMRDRDNHAAFIKLLDQQAQLINHRASRLQYAFSYAIAYKDKFIIMHLLRRPELKLRAMDIIWVLQMKDPELTAAMYEQLRNFAIDPDTVMEYLLPVKMLSEVNQSMVEVMVLREIDNLELGAALQANLKRFLQVENPLPFPHMNRLSIVHDCLIFLKKPQHIDQYTDSLCGIVALMQHCIMANPAALVQSVLAIADPASFQTDLLPPAILRRSQRFGRHAFHADQFWQEVIRNHYNKILGHKSQSFFSSVTSLTRPEQLSKMYQDLGFTVSFDSFHIRTKNALGKAATTIFKKKIYGQHHLDLPNDTDRYNQFYNSGVLEQPYIVMLVNIDFLVTQFPAYTPDKNYYPFEIPHYAVLTDFHYDSVQDTVTFDYMTWGDKYKIIHMSRVDFERYFQGAMGASSNIASMKLEL